LVSIADAIAVYHRGAMDSIKYPAKLMLKIICPVDGAEEETAEWFDKRAIYARNKAKHIHPYREPGLEMNAK